MDEITDVAIDGVFGNTDCVGIVLNWSAEGVGFGQITIIQHLTDGKIEIDDEYMGKDFVKDVLAGLVNKADIH